MYPVINKTPAKKTDQSGFGLIEVMIGMMIGLLLLAGISQFYVSSNQTDKTSNALNQIVENARYLTNRIGQEARMAGYTGLMQLTPVVLLNSSSALAYQYATAVSGFNNVASGALTTELSSHLAGDPQPINGTDVLILRTTADVQPVPLSAASATDSVSVINNLASSSRGCNAGTAVSGICVGDILLISDYRKAMIFQASTVTAAGAISHTSTGTPGNATTDWSGSSQSFDATSEVIPYQTVVYYLANNANNQPTLYRKENANAAVALIPGVANLQVTYGEDTDSDNSVNAYRSADSVTNWARVLSVRLALLISSNDDNVVAQPMSLSTLALPDGTTTANNRRLYRPIIFTVALRNRIQ